MGSLNRLSNDFSRQLSNKQISSNEIQPKIVTENTSREIEALSSLREADQLKRLPHNHPTHHLSLSASWDTWRAGTSRTLPHTTCLLWSLGDIGRDGTSRMCTMHNA
jgi:hypothetical protein